MKNKRGIAKNNFRADGGKAWNPGKVEFIGKRGSREAAPKAAEARRRMIEREEGGHPDSGRDKADRRAYPRHE